LLLGGLAVTMPPVAQAQVVVAQSRAPLPKKNQQLNKLLEQAQAGGG